MRRNVSPKLFRGELIQGAESPGAALGPAWLGQGRARATVTYPGQRQSCSAWEQHLPKAHHPISTAGSISAERCKMHWLRCWVQTHLAPVTCPAVVQPALPSASFLGQGSDPLMHCWAEKVLLKPFSSRKWFFYKDRISPVLIAFCSTKEKPKISPSKESVSHLLISHF